MEQNNRFFDFSGIIGRRGFILNFLIVSIINIVTFIFPMYMLVLIKPQYMHYFSSAKIEIASLPLLAIIWVIFCAAIRLVLIFPSIVRRIRDIRANDSKFIIPSVALYLIVTFLCSGSFLVLKYLYIAFIIYLMCVPGRITGQKPHSDLLKFNWGAFFGTWIWGLFNKSYKTLWMIPLSLLFAGFPFALICGMKGNKWAYKNKNYESLEKLHKSQETQSIVWTIIFPFLFIFTFIAFVFAAAQAVSTYSQYNPEFKAQLSSYYAQSYYNKIETMFENIEVKDGNYIFSINPKIWAKLSNSQRQHLFDSAGYYAASKIEGNNITDITAAPISSLSKVKIISTFNGETLAEFDYAQKDNSQPTAKYYKFNPYTSLP